MDISPSEKAKELGLEFPPAPQPAGVYRPVLVVDKFLYVSGQAPMQMDGTLMQGRVGDHVDMEFGKLAARQTALTMLSTIQTHFGSLDKIKRVVKVLGMVNCTPDFIRQPYVINGFSELLAELWGREYGIGVRSAVGMMLPDGIPVEIEAVFELH
ncbi:MAG: RidA family protein [Reichenbachiella sp.]|uniref:RidA family protein n=1 Tax=Reichenbachiella sp. TaxID=2184521 RepID=UPI002966598F|nr:RidA family protein [Reichenbachiella sp.]MDW3210100.1 RidA family protein [Reichenbachiella sp.]